jgi:molecular chaperone DnaK
MIFSTEKQLKEFGEKLSYDNKKSVEDALSELKKAHSDKDLDLVKSTLEKLNEAWYKASTEMYSQSGAETSSGDNGQTENVDYEEVKSE